MLESCRWARFGYDLKVLWMCFGYDVSAIRSGVNVLWMACFERALFMLCMYFGYELDSRCVFGHVLDVLWTLHVFWMCLGFAVRFGCALDVLKLSYLLL